MTQFLASTITTPFKTFKVSYSNDNVSYAYLPEVESSFYFCLNYNKQCLLYKDFLSNCIYTSAVHICNAKWKYKMSIFENSLNFN